MDAEARLLFPKVWLTPQLVGEVFKLRYVENYTMHRCTDTMMKKVFGSPGSTKSYYMLKNVSPVRRMQLKWILERIYFLLKFDYMGKDC